MRDWTAESLSAGRAEPELSLESLGEVAGAELPGYVRMRQEVVTSLARQAAEIAGARGVRFCFIEQSVASASYASGTLTGPPGAARAWRTGVDVAQIAEAGAVVEVAGYVADPARFQRELAGYRRLVPGAGRLAVITRPGPPDCGSAGDLATTVSTAAAAGCGEINFYCYGLYRMTALDSDRGALAAMRGG